MPRSKSDAEYTPIKGAVYEVLVTKLGPDDGWLRGETIQAEEFPDVDFPWLESNGSVRRVDGTPDASVSVPAPTPSPAAITPPAKASDVGTTKADAKLA